MSPSPLQINEEYNAQRRVVPLFDHRGNAKKILEAITKTRYEFINGMPTYNLVDTLAQAEAENDRMKMVELNMNDSNLYSAR